MKRSIFRALFLLVVFGVSNPGFALADELAVGDLFPAIPLADQHGEPVSVPGPSRLLLMAFDKQASDLVYAVLEDRSADYLDQQAAQFVADISAMPGLVTRMFALPKMRRRPYPIVLAEDAALLAFVPRQTAQVTVVRLQGGRVAEIDFAASDSGLLRFLGGR